MNASVPALDTPVPAAGRARRKGLWPRLRPVLFWAHLIAGCLAGVVILMMSVTGVLLTYERQIMATLEQGAWQARASAGPRQDLDALVAAATRADFEPSAVVLRADTLAPVQISAGRRQRVELDPVSAAPVAPAAPGVDAFFGTVTGLHRWFALRGDARDSGRMITGAANLLFIFILLSGAVLWLPRIFARPVLAAQIWFARSYSSAKARDYGWHHVIGFWSVLPLLAITSTATVFNYDWSQALVKDLAGPDRLSAPVEALREPSAVQASDRVALAVLAESAASAVPDWQRMTLTLAAPDADTPVEIVVDRGNGAQVQHQQTLLLDPGTGEVLARTARYADEPYRYARSVIRFLHTGEIFGVVGQTIAGLVSLGAALLVWTGIALAFRRLVLQPLRRRRRAA